MGNTQAARSSRESAWLDDRFKVAVSTGFRRTDPATGRTVELFLCPNETGGWPDQSNGFVAEAKDGQAHCFFCEEPHPIVEFLDADARNIISTQYTGDDPGGDGREAVNFGADQIAEAIRLTSRRGRPKARSKSVPR